jgi:hypothetical protein
VVAVTLAANGDWAYYIDGAPAGSGNSGSTFSGTPVTYLGAALSGLQRMTNGNVAEVMEAATAYSAAQLEAVFDELGALYGITVA